MKKIMWKIKILVMRIFLRFSKIGAVHYIGGAETLPAPLGSKEERRYIEMLSGENAGTAKSMFKNAETLSLLTI